MNISAKTEYACLAVMELAAHYGSGEPVRVNWIADRHGIPARFLVQILLQLKGAGIVSSTRGAAGGYQLIRDPAEMSLADVMAVIEGQSAEVTPSATTHSSTSRVLLAVWNEVKRVECEMLEQVTLADLVERARGDGADVLHLVKDALSREQVHELVDALIDRCQVGPHDEIRVAGASRMERKRPGNWRFRPHRPWHRPLLDPVGGTPRPGWPHARSGIVRGRRRRGALPHFFARSHKRGDADQSRVVHQLGDLRTPAQVLRSFFGRESQVTADAPPHAAPVEHDARTANLKQASFQRVSQRGLAGRGEAGQQHGGRSLAVPRAPLVRAVTWLDSASAIRPTGWASQWSIRSSRVERSRIMPAPTVRLVMRSMMMNAAGGSIAAVRVIGDRLAQRDGTAADLVEFQALCLLAVQRS